MCVCVTKKTKGNFDAKLFKCGVLLHFVINGWLLYNVYEKNVGLLMALGLCISSHVSF